MSWPDHTRRDTTDLWAAQSRDCAAPPIFDSEDHAHYVRGIHAGHAGCTQFLSAQKYLNSCRPSVGSSAPPRAAEPRHGVPQ